MARETGGRMPRLHVLSMEYRKGWKGFLAFMLIVALMMAFFISIFPLTAAEFGDVGGGLPEDGRTVLLTKSDSSLNLSWDWDGHDQTIIYRIIEDSAPHMATAVEVAQTTDRNLTLPFEEGEERYFGVIAVLSDSSEVPIGTASTVPVRSPIQDFMDTPYVRIFTAGREDIRMDEITGFISVEMYSWFFILMGFYIGFISIKSLGGDFDGRRADVLLSMPITRRRYLLEKFAATSLFLLVLLLVVGGVSALAIDAIGESGNLSGMRVILSMAYAWPLFLAVTALGYLLAIIARGSRGAVGALFGILLVQYIMGIVGNMYRSLEAIKAFTISTYWDYNAMLFDGVFSLVDALLLTALAALLLAIAAIKFDRLDLP